MGVEQTHRDGINNLLVHHTTALPHYFSIFSMTALINFYCRAIALYLRILQMWVKESIGEMIIEK